MGKVIRREVRKRGFFGWVFLLVFLGFNLLMVAWMLLYWSEVAKISTTSDAGRTGQAIGSVIGTATIAFFWVAGAVVTGLFALLTRGRKTIVEEYLD